MKLADFDLSFTYGQFYVDNVYNFNFSKSPKLSKGTLQHMRQGFLRINTYACFFTFVQWGTAHISVFQQALSSESSYTRIIGVPFEVGETSEIVFHDPEGAFSDPLEIAQGYYWLVVAQSLLGDPLDLPADIKVDFYFDPIPSLNRKSEIIKSDSMLTPTYPLLEF